MRPGIVSDFIYVLGALAVAAGLLVYLGLTATEEAFNLALGIVLGTIAAAIPPFLVRRNERRARSRAAALLWRDDMYLFQDWIAKSIEAEEWAPVRPSIIGPDQIADVAQGFSRWRSWQRVSRARRWSSELTVESATKAPAELAELAKRTFMAIEEARARLSKLTGGRPNRHNKRHAVQQFAERHPASRVLADDFEIEGE